VSIHNLFLEKNIVAYESGMREIIRRFGRGVYVGLRYICINLTVKPALEPVVWKMTDRCAEKEINKIHIINFL
jgi:hypothetical protein